MCENCINCDIGFEKVETNYFASNYSIQCISNQHYCDLDTISFDIMICVLMLFML